jgi:hypothetical protein
MQGRIQQDRGIRPLSVIDLLHGLLFVILLYVSVLWFATAERILSIPFLFWVAWDLHRFFRGKTAQLPYIPWLLAILMTLLPVDVSLNNAPGPPRFVPLVMGLPGPDLMEAAARGDMLLGGCIVTGYEAKWVWVW